MTPELNEFKDVRWQNGGEGWSHAIGRSNNTAIGVLWDWLQDQGLQPGIHMLKYPFNEEESHVLLRAKGIALLEARSEPVRELARQHEAEDFPPAPAAFTEEAQRMNALLHERFYHTRREAEYQLRHQINYENAWRWSKGRLQRQHEAATWARAQQRSAGTYDPSAHPLLDVSTEAAVNLLFQGAEAAGQEELPQGSPSPRRIGCAYLAPLVMLGGSAAAGAAFMTVQCNRQEPAEPPTHHRQRLEEQRRPDDAPQR